MTRVRAAIIGATAVGAGAVFGTGALLRRQAAIARRRIGKPLGEIAPDADRVWRRRFDAPPLDLLMLGDSIAAGLGAHRRKDTLGARVAKGLASRLERPVRLRTAAVVGSESSALARQLDGLDPDYRADVAVIVVGGNDVTHRVPHQVAVAHLTDAIRRLRARGTAVVVGTCPDLGALRPVPQPLRSLSSRISRRLARAQAAAAAAAGARPVSLRRAVGAEFLADPQGCSASTGSTRARWATGARPRRSSRRSSPSSRPTPPQWNRRRPTPDTSRSDPVRARRAWSEATHPARSAADGSVSDHPRSPRAPEGAPESVRDASRENSAAAAAQRRRARGGRLRSSPRP
ncbi:SGNH/GDSL hydrolase family protein [Microbacterium sp. Root53]|uniref:SGNH/GDSL hydrolase family protein n=1 Tax=Microbacterium sp. Root53 TaxID=1736553 RepID=UPI0026CC6126